MVRCSPISKKELIEFSEILTRWSHEENSRFYRQFFRSLGMSERQFYRRFNKSRDSLLSFDSIAVKRNLMRNRFYFEKTRKTRKSKIIEVNFDYSTH